MQAPLLCGIATTCATPGNPRKLALRPVVNWMASQCDLLLPGGFCNLNAGYTGACCMAGRRNADFWSAGLRMTWYCSGGYTPACCPLAGRR
jgi:hypothetical protein